MEVLSLHTEIENSMALQQQQDTGDSDNSLTNSSSSQVNDDEVAQHMAEQIGQGITRQGGNS